MDRRNRRALILGAALVILGIILSGPPLVLLVGLLKPQPAWVDASTLAANYHWLQTLPYWFGFLLLAGNVLFVAAAGRLPARRDRVNAALALVSVAIYGALVSVNYLVQVAYLPQAATLPGEIVAALSMVNPASVTWLVEMFSYAFLGVAMWLGAPGFRGNLLRDAVRWLLITDGMVSLLAVGLSAITPTWVLTPWGLLAYAAWNLLVVVAMALVILTFRQRLPLSDWAADPSQAGATGWPERSGSGALARARGSGFEPMLRSPSESARWRWLPALQEALLRAAVLGGNSRATLAAAPPIVERPCPWANRARAHPNPQPAH